MRKVWLLVITMLIVCLLLVGCGHDHIWNEATCVSPKTCQKCGETEGAPLGHDWKPATCTEAKTCSRCGATEGDALGHDWIEADCLAAKTCSRCMSTIGEALGHDWKEADCTTPKTCLRCGATEGEALGHDWIQATCTEPTTCSRCGFTNGVPLGHDTPNRSCTSGDICTRCGEEFPELGHEWQEATCTEPATCSRCGVTDGKPLGHEESKAVKENEKKATCTEAGSYDDVIYCERCGAELERKPKTEKALGHTTTNGTCSRCGLEIYELVSGNGDDVISDIEVGDGLYRVHFENSGSRNFVVWVYDSTGDRDLAVNEIGKYSGDYLLLGSAPFVFEIESSGKWSYQIERIGTTDNTGFEGKGCYVTDMFPGKSGTYHITHDGKSNFVIWLYTTDGRDLIVNEIGSYDGRKLLSIPSGSNALLVIEADGNWSVSPVS